VCVRFRGCVILCVGLFLCVSVTLSVSVCVVSARKGPRNFVCVSVCVCECGEILRPTVGVALLSGAAHTH
jgi:hypothetical protein